MRIAPLALIADTNQRHQAVVSDSTLTHFDHRATQACVLYTDWVSAFLQGKQPDFATSDAQLKTLLSADFETLKTMANDKIGYVNTALALAHWAVHQADASQALSLIVSCGGDADTNGAIAGALLGAKHDDVFPSSWSALIEEKSWYSQCIDDFLASQH